MKEKRQAGIFLALIFGVMWIAFIAAYGMGVRLGDTASVYLQMAQALLPMIIAIAVCAGCKEKLSAEGFGLLPHFKGNWKRYLFAYFFPTLFTVLAAGLFFLLFPQSYDPASQELVSGLAGTGGDENYVRGYVYTQVILAVIAGPLINAVLSVAEEIGFRGFLLPRLRVTLGGSGVKSALLCSAIWALWYVPLYFDSFHYGLDYPGFPYLGILTGFVFYFLLGFLISYFTMKTGSIYPAMLMRSGVTALATIPLYFSKGSTQLLIGPSTFGVFGCMALFVFAVLYFFRMRRMEKSGTLFPQEGSLAVPKK